MKNRMRLPLLLSIQPVSIGAGSIRSGLFALLCVAISCQSVQAEVGARRANVPVNIQGFLNTSCIDCHDGPDGEAGFDLSRVLSNGIDLQDKKLDPPWVRIIDRVAL
ncbi:MAG: hypothetical protein VX902_03060, partial [Planctomycetota bacterium]|nr:hypothetical protein [Planctomycetota bacterium]